MPTCYYCGPRCTCKPPQTPESVEFTPEAIQKMADLVANPLDPSQRVKEAAKRFQDRISKLELVEPPEDASCGGRMVNGDSLFTTSTNPMPTTTPAEIEAAIEKGKRAVQQMRELSPIWKPLPISSFNAEWAKMMRSPIKSDRLGAYKMIPFVHDEYYTRLAVDEIEIPQFDSSMHEFDKREAVSKKILDHWEKELSNLWPRIMRRGFSVDYAELESKTLEQSVRCREFSVKGKAMTEVVPVLASTPIGIDVDAKCQCGSGSHIKGPGHSDWCECYSQ